MRRSYVIFPSVIQVLAQHSPKTVSQVPVPPVLGLRWGRPSEFQFAAESTVSFGTTTGGQGVVPRWELDREVVIRGREQHRVYAQQMTPLGDGGEELEVEGISKTAFALPERVVVHERVEAEGQVTYVQPIVETVAEFLVFNFDLGVAGDRGQPTPPPTPPLPDYDDLYGEG